MRASKIEFDKLQLLFMKPYIIDLPNTEGTIKIIQPTIGSIVDYGEHSFYGNLNTFVTNSSSYKVPLWDMGVNWNDISDFELFLMLYKGLEKSAYDMFLEDIDFSDFEIMIKPIIDDNGNESSKTVLYDQEHHVEIDEEVYQYIHQYLQAMFNMYPEEKYTKDKMLQRWWVDAEKREKAREDDKRKKGKAKDSYSILPIISACINHPGFKYNLEQLKDVGVFQFYDSVKRLQIYESSTALMRGMYSGFVDGSKIKTEDYNFMRDI